MKIKTERNVSYPEARRLCEPKKTAGPAQAAAAKTVFGEQVYSYNKKH